MAVTVPGGSVGFLAGFWWRQRSYVKGFLRAEWERTGVTSHAIYQRWAALGSDSPHAVQCWTTVVADVAEAEQWAARGITAAAVPSWKAAVRGFDELDSWLRIDVRSASLVRDWKAAYASLDEVVRWQACVGDADVAQAWHRAGLTPADWAVWSWVSTDPEKVTGWRAAVGNNWTAWRWQRVGVDDPELVGQLTRAGVAESELRRWESLGVEPDLVTAWRRFGSIDEALTWVRHSGMDVAEAWAWHEAGMSPETASSWRSVKVTSADDAAKLHAKGLSPADVKRWRIAGVTTIQSITHWASRWTPDDAEHWRALCGDCDLAAAWELGERVAWDDAVLRRWAALGVRGSDEIAAAVAATGYERWMMALDLFERFSATGVAFDESLEFLASVDSRQAEEWIEHGFRTWADVRPWHDARVRPVAAAVWREASVADPRTAARLEHAGIDVPEVVSWEAVGVAPGDVVMWRSRWPAALASQWVAETSTSIAEAWDWHETTDGDLSQATVWARAGIRMAAQARLWRRAGVEPREAGAWVSAGFTGVSDVTPWRAARYAPAEARRWAAVVSSPEDVTAWRTCCEASPDHVAVWRGAGVDAPDRARQLLGIGLTAHAYRDLADGASPSQLKQRLRRQAVEYAGLQLVEGVPTLDVEAVDPADVVAWVTEVVTAASRAREPVLRVHHGAPHLSPEAMQALPDARYLRGGQKAVLYRALEDKWFPYVEHADSRPRRFYGEESGMGEDLAEDGATLDLALTPAPDGTEFLVLTSEAAK